jgi:hypothetical protein
MALTPKFIPLTGTDDTVYGNSYSHQTTVFVNNTSGQVGIVFMRPGGTVSQPTTVGDQIPGSFSKETSAVDQSVDFWIQHGQGDFTLSNIWFYADEIESPASQFEGVFSYSAGWTGSSTSDPVNTWLSASTNTAFTWYFARGKTTGGALQYRGELDLYALEKASTPTGTPAAEGATFLGNSVMIVITNLV